MWSTQAPFLKISEVATLSHTVAAPLTHHWPLWCNRKVVLLQHQEKILMIRQQCDHTTQQCRQRHIKLSRFSHSLSSSHHLSHSWVSCSSQVRVVRYNLQRARVSVWVWERVWQLTIESRGWLCPWHHPLLAKEFYTWGSCPARPSRSASYTIMPPHNYKLSTRKNKD